jgi:hypothetical protein
VCSQAIFPWYGKIVQGKLYGAAEFLAVEVRGHPKRASYNFGITSRYFRIGATAVNNTSSVAAAEYILVYWHTVAPSVISQKRAREKCIRLAPKMQVGPCVPVEIQR